MLELSSSSEGDIKDRFRQVVAAAARVDQAHAIRRHCHARGQLLQVVGGGDVRVDIQGCCWSLSGRNAIWIPSGAGHEIRARGQVEYRSLYVDEVASRHIPVSAGAVEISPLLTALITESAAFGCDYSLGSPEDRLNTVLLDQMRALENTSLSVPMPVSPVLVRLCETIVADPADPVSLGEWGQRYGASERNLARLFKRETGLSFSQWRRRVQVVHAIECMEAGSSVTRIAMSLGYRSPAAFTAMFRKLVGVSPLQYMNRRGATRRFLN